MIASVCIPENILLLSNVGGIVGVQYIFCKFPQAENAELQNQVGNLIDENIVDESVNSIE